MKQMIEKFLKELGWNYEFIDNLDDVSMAFQANPKPSEMIQICISMRGCEYEKYIQIKLFKINYNGDKVNIWGKLLAGHAVLIDKDTVDYDFYRKILTNYKIFA